jgi:hypothetical protein
LVESASSEADAGDSGLDFVACGGDLLGTWTVSSATLLRAPTPSPPPCPGRVLRSVTPVAAGWATFRSDGTMTGTLSVGNDQTFAVPLSCTDASDCNSLQGILNGASASVSCATSEPAECMCGVVLTPLLAPPLGAQYHVDGGSFYLGVGGRPFQYCVRGNTISWLVTIGILGTGEVVQVNATR